MLLKTGKLYFRKNGTERNHEWMDELHEDQILIELS
jgi:hypothetical protein